MTRAISCWARVPGPSTGAGAATADDCARSRREDAEEEDSGRTGEGVGETVEALSATTGEETLAASNSLSPSCSAPPSPLLGGVDSSVSSSSSPSSSSSCSGSSLVLILLATRPLFLGRCPSSCRGMRCLKAPERKPMPNGCLLCFPSLREWRKRLSKAVVMEVVLGEWVGRLEEGEEEDEREEREKVEGGEEWEVMGEQWRRWE